MKLIHNDLEHKINTYVTHNETASRVSFHMGLPLHVFVNIAFHFDTVSRGSDSSFDISYACNRPNNLILIFLGL